LVIACRACFVESLTCLPDSLAILGFQEFARAPETDLAGVAISGSMKHKMVMNIMSSTDAKTARAPGLCKKHAKRAEGAG
jgi:hypothetical protein